MSSYGQYSVDFSNPNSTWAIAASLVQNDSLVLDVGCSAGQVAERLRQYKGCTVDGIELDPVDGAAARGRCRKVYIGDVTDLAPTINARYQHVLFLDVLEHVLDPVEALRSICPLLEDDGTVIVSVPNMAHASVRLSLLQGRFPYEDDGLLDRTHLRFFDREQLESTITAAGYSVVRTSRTFRDIPDRVIAGVLESVGLTATEAFIGLMNAEEAATYQYVVELRPGSVGPEEPARTAYVAPLHQYRYFYEDAVQAARDAQKAAEEARAHAADIAAALQERCETSVPMPHWVVSLLKRMVRARNRQ